LVNRLELLGANPDIQSATDGAIGIGDKTFAPVNVCVIGGAELLAECYFAITFLVDKTGHERP
jgi:hypothetical protein